MKTAEALNSRHLMRLLWRQRRFILTVVGILMLATVAILFSMTPQYRADGRLFIEFRPVDVAQVSDIFGAPGTTDAVFQAQVESVIATLRSRALIELVIEKLDLSRNKELVDAEQNNLSTVSYAILGYLRHFIPGRNGLNSVSPYSAALVREKLVEGLQNRLTVIQFNKGSIIDVSFYAVQPEVAANVVNTLMNEDIEFDRKIRYETAAAATAWLTTTVDELSKKLAASETEIEVFRQKTNLLGGTAGPISAQVISQINEQRLDATAARAEAEARLSAIGQFAKNHPAEKPADIGEVLQSKIIQELEVQQAQVRRKLADMSTELGDRHPQYIAARSELAYIQDKLRTETQKVVLSMQNQVASAQASEKYLSLELERAKDGVGRSSLAEVQLRLLTRKAEADRASLQGFLKRQEETRVQMETAALQPSARIVSKAWEPARPSYPRKLPILFLALVGGSALATALAYMRDNLAAGLRSGEQIESLLGVRCIGLIPRVRASGKRGQRALSMASNPSPILTESISSILTSICSSDKKTGPKTLLITSSQPGEGKTITSANLAHLAGRWGMKCLLIDADFRRRQLSLNVGAQDKPGLSEYVETDCPTIIWKDNELAVDFIPAGKLMRPAAELLWSSKIDKLLAAAGDVYDLIVIDSPPLCAVPDARALAPRVSGVLYVIGWGTTPLQAIIQGHKYLVDSQARIFGAILTMVNERKHAEYGFADSSLCDRKLIEYRGGVERPFDHVYESTARRTTRGSGRVEAKRM